MGHGRASRNPPVSILCRITGLGTVGLGCFALYYCFAFLDDLWGTPQRNIALGVTGCSLFVVYVGVMITAPEFFPQSFVSLNLFGAGVLIMLAGLGLVGWVAYNLLIARQPEFQMGNLRLPFVMIVVGFGFGRRGFQGLRKRQNT